MLYEVITLEHTDVGDLVELAFQLPVVHQLHPDGQSPTAFLRELLLRSGDRDADRLDAVVLRRMLV